MADRDAPAAPAAPVPDGIHGWTLRLAAAGPCAGCGTETGAAYQLRRLTPRGWVDVAGQRWCLRCWSGSRTRSPAAGDAQP